LVSLTFSLRLIRRRFFAFTFLRAGGAANTFPISVNRQVLTIITDHIPEVKAIDLSENKLTNLDAFVQFTGKLVNLSILYLADNRIPDTRSNIPHFFRFWCVGRNKS
jgi:Leucine-rich repeat (LRR) protein